MPIRDPVSINPKSKGNKRELTCSHSDGDRNHIWRWGSEDVNEITSIHKAQLLNYLKATGIKLGVLANFSRERNTVDVERIPNLI